MFHILLFTSRLPESEEISRRLAARENYIVHRVGNLREAGTLLTRQKIDLAIVAVSPNDSLVYSLNMLQDGLPILLIAEVSNQYVTERQRKMAWGIVTYERLTEVFPNFDFMDEPKDKVEEIFIKEDEAPKKVLNTKKLSQLISGTLQKFSLEMVLLTRQKELVGIHSRGDQDQMVRVGRFVRNSRKHAAEKGQMTWFTDKKTRTQLDTNIKAESFLLLTIPYDEFLITLASKEHGSVLHMRKAARLLMAGIRKVETDIHEDPEAYNQTISSQGMIEVPHRPNLSPSEFALVWKTRRSLTIEEKFELNRALPTIGRAHGCILNPISIQDNYVQVMSTCPAGRTSAWLVQIYKKRSLEHVQKELDHHDDFWMEGYYAQPSDVPLSRAELSIYLGPEPDSKRSPQPAG